MGMRMREYIYGPSAGAGRAVATTLAAESAVGSPLEALWPPVGPPLSLAAPSVPRRFLAQVEPAGNMFYDDVSDDDSKARDALAQRAAGGASQTHAA